MSQKNNSSHDKDDLKWKIDRLLQCHDNHTNTKTTLYSTERILIALLLWTRTNEYRDIFKVHSYLLSWLLQFTQQMKSRILLLQPQQPKPEEQNTFLLIRLVAQVYLHMDNHVEDKNEVSLSLLEPLGELLFDCWKEKIKNGTTTTTTMITIEHDNDVPAAVYKWLEQRKDRDEYLREMIVYRMILNDYDSIIHETIPPSLDENQIITTTESDVETIFHQTLQQLLNQNTYQRVSIQEWASLFWNYTNESTISSSYWTPLLQWWVDHDQKMNEIQSNNKNGTSPSRRIWAKVLLETTMKQLSTRHVNHSRMDWQNDRDIAKQYSKFLMACVVDPNDNHDTSIRTLAWSTIAMSIEANGWEWTYTTRQSSTSRRLGTTYTMCTMIRLAAGEWKIQLEQYLQQNNVLSSTTKKDQFITIQSCAQVLAHGFTYLQELASKESETSPSKNSFSPEAFIHLRKSFEETMHTTVEFLTTTTTTTTDSKQSLEIYQTAICLFGPFLTEWDVFMERNIEMVNALAFAMDLSQDNYAVQTALLAGLTTVLASSEGDRSKIEILHRYHLLGERLENFLISYFNQIGNTDHYRDGDGANQNEGTLQWCSQIIDLWTSMTRNGNMTKVLESVRLCLKRAVARDSVQLDISSLALCYITLQGDSTPTDEDAAFLQRAFEKADIQELTKSE